jgi:hypothetical protein
MGRFGHSKQQVPFTEDDVANQIWLRAEGEPRKAHQLLEIYLAQEGERSLRKAAEAAPFKVAMRTIENYSQKYDWMKRACAYDAHMEAVAQAERERLRAENEAKWEKRREAIKEKEFELAEKMVARVEEMLAVPLFEVKEEVTEEDGDDCTNKITITMPAGWRLRDAFRGGEVASNLFRKSADMATEKHEIDFDVKNASDAELDQIIKEGRKA